MREDMAKVIVTRPRILDSVTRRGRSIPPEVLPKKIGLRRHAQERGGFKMLNENLSPLRRFLEAQAGRPWNAVFAEVAANLKVTSTVQQHVRDHLKDFVNIHRRPSPWLPGSWFEPLYVDDRGVLRRTVGRARVRRSSPSGEQDRVRLADNLELRNIAGHWYEITLGRLPEPDYRPVERLLKQPSRPYAAASSVRMVEVVVRQLVTPAVRDVVTGKPVLSGPEIDEREAWRRYRAENPDRCYAIGKRQLSRRELRHHHLKNEPDACLGRRISSC